MLGDEEESGPVRSSNEDIPSPKQLSAEVPSERLPTKKKPPPLAALPGFFSKARGYMSLGGKSDRKSDDSPHAGNLDTMMSDEEMGQRFEKLNLAEMARSENAENQEQEEKHMGSNSKIENEEEEESSPGAKGLENGTEHTSEPFVDLEDDAKGGLSSFDGVEDEAEAPSQKKKRGCWQRHRRAVCLGGACCLILVLLLGVCALIGYLLLRPRAPAIHFTNLKVNQLVPNITPLPPRATLNFNVSATLGLDNPNYFSLGYSNTSAYIVYRNLTIATVPIDEGEFPARDSRDIALSAIGKDFNVVSKLKDLSSDLNRNRVPLTVNTVIPGTFSILGIYHHSFQATVACNLTVNPDSPSFRNVTLVDDSCTYKITL